MTDAWIGVVGALAGSLITGLIALAGAWFDERGRNRSMALQERRDDSLIKRQAFADFLNAALVASNEVTSASRAARRAGLPMVPLDSPEVVAAWSEFSKHSMSVIFLLDPEGVEALYEFENGVIAEAAKAGANVPFLDWNEQAADLLAAMRRSLSLK